jgi:hypothetical protein
MDSSAVLFLKSVTTLVEAYVAIPSDRGSTPLVSTMKNPTARGWVFACLDVGWEANPGGSVPRGRNEVKEHGIEIYR